MAWICVCVCLGGVSRSYESGKKEGRERKTLRGKREGRGVRQGGVGDVPAPAMGQDPGAHRTSLRRRSATPSLPSGFDLPPRSLFTSPTSIHGDFSRVDASGAFFSLLFF